MPNLIVVNGCSFTEELYLKSQDRWTTKCGVTTNLAQGGGSNDRIFYTTVEYLNTNKPDTLIIGWTSPDRFMLPNKNGSRLVITPTHSFDENIGGDYTEFADFYFKNSHNFFTSFEKTLTYMIHIQKVCRDRNIKLLYFNALLPAIDEQSLRQLASQAFMAHDTPDVEKMGIEYNYKKLCNLLDQLDKDIWIKDFWYSLKEHCIDYPTDKGGHPDVEGSNYWAELVKQYL